MTAATPRIAIVDDDPRVLRGLRRLLVSAQYEVDTYGSGAAFLAAVSTNRPDCVLLDLHMPQVNGFEVLANLAKANQLVPVILITGDETPEACVEARRLGASAYLGKPVDRGALVKAIEAARLGNTSAT